MMTHLREEIKKLNPFIEKIFNITYFPTNDLGREFSLFVFSLNLLENVFLNY